MYDVGIIDFAVYENGNEFRGIANVTLPDVNRKLFTVNGAGIGGDFETPIVGQFDAMTCSIAFRDDAPEAARKLATFRKHTIDLRVAHEDYDEVGGKIKMHAHKYILDVIPKSQKNGSVAPSAAQAASGDYSVLSYKEYVDGKLIRHVDPTNYIDIDADGDNAKDIRKALGK